MSDLQKGDIASITLARSSQGIIRLTVRTEATGMVEYKIEPEDFGDLIFGVTEVPAVVGRVNANLKPPTGRVPKPQPLSKGSPDLDSVML